MGFMDRVLYYVNNEIIPSSIIYGPARKEIGDYYAAGLPIVV